MKLQTRQEIVDGVKGDVIYIIDAGDSYSDLCLSEPEAKELYELLKEKFEGKKCVCSKLLSKTGIHVENCPIIN